MLAYYAPGIVNAEPFRIDLYQYHCANQVIWYRVPVGSEGNGGILIHPVILCCKALHPSGVSIESFPFCFQLDCRAFLPRRGRPPIKFFHPLQQVVLGLPKAVEVLFKTKNLPADIFYTPLYVTFFVAFGRVAKPPLVLIPPA